MFFGLEVKASQAQAKSIELENTLKLTQACLEPAKNGKKEPVCLVVDYMGKQHILCVLDPSQSWQCQLDILFEAFSEVKFFVRGSGTIHLTGYELEEEYDPDDDMMYMSSNESDSGESSEVVAAGRKSLTNGKSPNKVKTIPVKRKQQPMSNGKNPNKRPRRDQEKGKRASDDDEGADEDDEDSEEGKPVASVSDDDDEDDDENDADFDDNDISLDDDDDDDDMFDEDDDDDEDEDDE